MSNSSEEKSEKASKRKLRKQREQGSIPRTSDMVTMLNVIVGIIIIYSTLGIIEREYLDFFNSIFNLMNDKENFLPIIGIYGLATTSFMITGAIVLGSLFVMILFVTLYQGGIPFSFTPITPSFDRLNPAQGFERMVGRRTWIESLIQAVRMSIWIIISLLLIWFMYPHFIHIDLCGADCGLEVLATLMSRWLPIAVGFLLLLCGIEMIVQKGLFLHEQKMSKSDVKRETKEQVGSPEVRRERNRLRQQLAQEAENSDKTLANMCFYFGDAAVGLRYVREEGGVPRVSVKARGEGAIKLRRYLSEEGHPQVKNQKITLSCIKTASGAPVKKEIFEDLAKAMSEM